MTGYVSYRVGLSAEDAVVRRYRDCGRTIAATRWRGACGAGGGEIDLIARDGDEVIFVEVKKAATHDRAVAALSRAQMGRIYRSASAFLESEPRGQLTPVRFDLATVDRHGDVAVLENAFGI